MNSYSYIDFRLFTDSFGRLLMVQRYNEHIFLLFGLQMGVVFSNVI